MNPLSVRSILIVKPDTVVRWHRAGFRLFWRVRSRRGPGRPKIPAETRALIWEVSKANVLWGAPRIHGELLKLGIDVSQSTVAKYMVKRVGPPSQAWKTFLKTMRMASRQSTSLSCRRLASSSCSGLLSWITADGGYCMWRQQGTQRPSGLHAKLSRRFHGKRGRRTFFAIGMPHTALRIDDDSRGCAFEIGRLRGIRLGRTDTLSVSSGRSDAICWTTLSS